MLEFWNTIKNDDIWSKVVAGLIVAFIVYLLGIISGLFKGGRRGTLLNPLISIPLLLKTIFVFLLNPVIKEVLFNLIIEKKIKVSDLMKGEWKLNYASNKEWGEERFVIKKNQYLHIERKNSNIEMKNTFELRNQVVDLMINKITFTKFNKSSQKIHADETLQIINRDTITRTDKLGFTLTYTRVSKEEAYLK